MNKNNIKRFKKQYSKQFNEINNKHSLVIAGAHLCDEKGRRVFSYFYPEKVLKSELYRTLKESFFQKKDRAMFFEIVNIRSTKKKPLVWTRISSNDIKSISKKEKSYEIFIPENLFNTDTKSFLKNKPSDLYEYLKPLWYKIKDTPQWESFYSYFCKKFNKILGSKIGEKDYKSPFDIYVLISSIMFYKWKHCYFFPTSPPGGFFVILQNTLKETDITHYSRKSQEITDMFKFSGGEG